MVAFGLVSLFLFIFMIFAFCMVGFAILSRMDGGGYNYLKYGLTSWIVSIPILLCALDMTLTNYPILVAIPISGLAYGISVLGWRMGLGQYNRIVYANRYTLVEPEKIDPIVSFFFGKDPKTHPYTKREERDLDLEIYGEDRFALRCLFGQMVLGLITFSGLLVISLLTGFIGSFVTFLVGAILYRTLPYIIDEKIHNKLGLEINIIAEHVRGVLFILPMLLYLLYSLLKGMV